VSGDLTDVVSNIGLVRSFGAARREQQRLTMKIQDEMQAQRLSLRSLERLRQFHAITVFLVTAGVLVWSVELWRRGQISTGTWCSRRRSASPSCMHRAISPWRWWIWCSRSQTPRGSSGARAAARDARRRGGAAAGGEQGIDRASRREFPLSERPVGAARLLAQRARRPEDWTRGRSGAGKSTIIAMLQRLYDPDAGEVLIDDQVIAHVTQESLRGSIAVVQQDISLFHRSLLENLRYGRPEATDEEVFRAVDAAGCAEFNRRPAGRVRNVGGRARMKLSGGQRQRIAIARAS